MKRTVYAVDEVDIGQQSRGKRSRGPHDDLDTILQLDILEFECVICSGVNSAARLYAVGCTGSSCDTAAVYRSFIRYMTA